MAMTTKLPKVDDNLEADAVGFDRLRPVRQISRNSATTLYNAVGCIIDDFPRPVMLADALTPDCPIIGASQSFSELSGYSRTELLGCNCRILLKDVPGCNISRSGRKNLRSMIRMCRLIGLSTMGNTNCCQTNRKRDGETFLNSFAVGLVMLGDHPFLVGIQSKMCIGSHDELSQITQEHHASIEQIRLLLQEHMTQEDLEAISAKDVDFLPPRPRNFSGNTKFSSAGLTERVILLNDKRSVMRREPYEIPNGCVVIGDQKLTRTRQGLFFAVRLEGVLREAWNTSWPKLGMTKISPDEMKSTGYPMRAEWCGESVCVGGDFQAFRRDKPEHHTIGFSKPSASDVTCFEAPRPRWQGRTTTPWELGEGDVLGMLYTYDGHVHLTLNYQTVLSIDSGKPLQDDDYYALVDCQGQAYEVMLLPFDMPVKGCMHDVSLQPLVSHTAVDYAVKTAAHRAVSNCKFSVSIADPSQPDMPLIGVSSAFEDMTGYSCEEIVGLNCRFLNHDCQMSPQQQFELRRACQTGKPFTGLLQNRRKSGEIFMNLLDLRGLTVARDAETGEHIWYLVGIQSDVTGLVNENGHADVSEVHARELQSIASYLREELQSAFAMVAMASSPQTIHETTASTQLGSPGGDGWVPPAATGVERGPKPPTKPMIELLSDAAWVNFDSEDDGSEPEQVHKEVIVDTQDDSRGQRKNTATSTASRTTTVTAQEHLSWMPILGAFALGMASMLCLHVLSRKRTAGRS